jgi:hypothetical protein
VDQPLQDSVYKGTEWVGDGMHSLRTGMQELTCQIGNPEGLKRKLVVELVIVRKRRAHVVVGRKAHVGFVSRGIGDRPAAVFLRIEL